ncbi:MAG: methyltransferase domain-containing protein [Pseudomonadota bacterium]
MEQSASYWDRAAHNYSQLPAVDEDADRKKLRITRDYLRPDMEILDLGCGTGSTAIALAPFVRRIDAIDFSTRMIDIAEAKAEAANIDNVVFDVSKIDHFVVPDQTFDAVLGLGILHLLSNKEEVIAKVHRWLKPGGTFITSTVCLGESMGYFKLIGPVCRLFGVIPLVKVFTARELATAIGEAGFDIDYEWQPKYGRSAFIVAKKVG